MEDLRSTHSNNPFHKPPGYVANRPSNARDEWEDWSDDEQVTPILDDGEDLLIDLVGDDNNSQKAPLPSRKSSYVLPGTRGQSLVPKPSRLKSRARQKAQNAKAGIKLVTDTSKLRRQQQQQPQHVAYQLKMSAEADPRKGQFADQAALQALEGDQSQSSVGNWHWLKKQPSLADKRIETLKASHGDSRQSDLSPSDRPIMIGLALQSGDQNGRSPLGLQKSQTGPTFTQSPQLKSIWSPDTEDNADSPFRTASSRVASSVYSQPGTISNENAPPMPAVPIAFRNLRSDRDDDDDNFTPVTLFEEDGSPVTTRTKSTRSKGHTRSPATVGTQSGWWDHVKTPFIEQSPSNNPNNPFQPSASNPFAPKPSYPEPEPKKAAEDEWWKGVDEKKQSSPYAPKLGLAAVTANTGSSSAAHERSSTIASCSMPTPPLQQTQQNKPELCVRGDSNARARSMRAQVTGGSSASAQTQSEKARILAEENNRSPTEQPPPYSPPPQQGKGQPQVRYRAVFPPGHPMEPQFPPSPGPESPGLGATMTSQGGIRMTDVPLTPPLARLAPSVRGEELTDIQLPDRAPGTYLPGNHLGAAVGNSPAARMERQRRRHEKEDAVARKIGGFWRGRGAVSENGCWGRMGREGRKRRRIWIGVIGALIAVIVLVVVLCVVLLGKTGAPVPQDTIWLNLTDFPPIPTGVLTVVGAENSEDVQTCVEPQTMWSCQLPQEQSEANLPYAADQPMFVIQIQWDNSTKQFWDVPDGTVPTYTPLPPSSTSSVIRQTPTSTTAPVQSGGSQGGNIDPSKLLDKAKQDREKAARSLVGRATSGVRDLLQARQASPNGFNPNFVPEPALPSFQEMFFLGNTTDFIQSDRKAGETTPFYISFLPSLNSTPVGPNAVPLEWDNGPLSKRDMLEERTELKNLTLDAALNDQISGNLVAPPRNADGTGKPAVMSPHPIQQQLRLYDRGLDTEHFGFYTYFNKTIYLKSTDPLDSETGKEGDVPSDMKGGSLQSEAQFVAVWAWTRFHVQIWTRRGGMTKMAKADPRGADPDNKAEAGRTGGQLLEVRRPGTFPYPITVRQDTHGGPFAQKGTNTFPVDTRGRVDLEKWKLQINRMDITSELVNPRSNFNPSYGGIDGGHGGCKCAWTNFVGVDGQTFGGSGGGSR